MEILRVRKRRVAVKDNHFLSGCKMKHLIFRRAGKRVLLQLLLILKIQLLFPLRRKEENFVQFKLKQKLVVIRNLFYNMLERHKTKKSEKGEIEKGTIRSNALEIFCNAALEKRRMAFLLCLWAARL